MRYLASKSGVTSKTGLGFVQGHWKWHHLIDRIRDPIFAFHSKLLWRYLVSFARYSDLLVENREFFYTPLVFSARAGGGDPVGIS